MSASRLSPGSADALLFDLGRVVIDFDNGRTVARWADQAGRTPSDIASRFIPDDLFWSYETGKIGDAEFFSGLRRSLGVDLSDAQLLEGWNATFIGEMPGMADLLAQAALHLPLYAFSNTNAAHVAHFTHHHGQILSHFRQIFLSSSIGLRKPHAQAYDYVVEAIGVPAERIVFFDDLIENIDGAKACGLITVHVRSSADVGNALAALGLAGETSCR